jgi:hypothetical protein
VEEETNECPACAEKRLHSVREWRDYHPLAREGYTQGQGWTSPELDPGRIIEHAAPRVGSGVDS